MIKHNFDDSVTEYYIVSIVKIYNVCTQLCKSRLSVIWGTNSARIWMSLKMIENLFIIWFCPLGCQCQASGDPHFTTCDSKTFDYQGACSYTLVTNDCPGANIDLNDIIFRVVITTVQWKNSDRTRTKEVTIILIKGEEKVS